MSSPALTPRRGWVIQKFGGTSVGKFPDKIADDVVKVWNESNRVAVVCSARSSHTKTEGTTSRLLASADVVLDADDDNQYLHFLEKITIDHVENAMEMIQSKKIQAKLIEDTHHEIEEARKLLYASQIIGEVSPKTLDCIMSCGEKLSCLFMAALLNDRGIPAEYVDLSNVVTKDFGTVLDATFYRSLASRLHEIISAIDSSKVPVVTGYFGTIPGGLLNGVGRGYTDLCAALVAVGVDADELQIWKEVDGIFTADPRKVTDARLLQSVTPEEASELTYYGSEVIHPFTMEQVIKARIPIRIKNVENPAGEGTIIYPQNVGRKGEATPPHPPTAVERLPSSIYNKIKTATAVTAKSDIVVVNIHSNKKTLSHGFLAHIFSTLDKYRLVVDLISTSEVYVSMALYVTKTDRKLLRSTVEELKRFGEVEVTHDMAIVSLVGIHMKQLIGIAGAMFKTLADERINIEMISQGANEINISCVINKNDTVKALNAIHSKIITDPFKSNLAIELTSKVSELRLDQY
ncbi:Aspartokinase [Komagataella phaffii CBS 7435]|uniref:Aspartokinase n=2 Tax=Komagataella phaffii TaxID=460519 RepID=C4R700_KOMPG|nr:Aspartate kinase (L-aspartate 4-P-transferase) [Komagataella phaffii GS115]AOA64443.1 GQ67_04460T0 [Komagataella phaffii]CAH2451275.1 Aspartokinase [Komagataella phaffii CBS 7435]AOA69442.1 GQ68_04432T0 [Komagataella phaffii GS115]CAY71375.1 Aspartate kinase (L-aspartate 4-P-transferase) [Komagataella phaffii GS115]CCA41018.1 Aspartokinase [Komagataella phaffii CBS 7435]